MELDIIITTKQDLSELIESSIKKFLPLQQEGAQKSEKSRLDIDEAIEALKLEGFKISKSYLYTLTHKNEVPYEKFGSRVFFEKNELFRWARSRNRPDRKLRQINLLAKSARAKNLQSFK